MGTMNCIVSHSTVICYRFFLKVCSKEHNLELFQITLWLASQVIKRGDGSITPVRTKKSSWTLLRMVMVERLVRIFLNEKYSYFLSQLFSTVMSGTTTNDMKHRFGHVVPKDAIYLLYYIFCFRVWQRVSRVVQEQHRNGDKTMCQLVVTMRGQILKKILFIPVSLLLGSLPSSGSLIY